MTGFFSKSFTYFNNDSQKNSSLQIQVKSVNGKYLDLKFKSNFSLLSIENELKKIAKNFFSRGSLDCSLNYVTTDSNSRLDFEKINNFISDFSSQVMTSRNIEYAISPTHFIRDEFQVSLENSFNLSDEQFLSWIYESWQVVLKGLSENRLEEGKEIGDILKDKFEILKHIVHSMAEMTLENQKVINDKYSLKNIQEKMHQFFQNDSSMNETQKFEVDYQRLAQEIIFYLEKYDIQEEIDRLNIHLFKVEKLFEINQVSGKEFDFIMQELLREFNTIGAKSFLLSLRDEVIKGKLLIDQIKEQVQNLQ